MRVPAIMRWPGRIPEVEAASPFIISHAFLRVPKMLDYFRPVQVVGIRLPERAEVSDFEQGLFVQAGMTSPTFDPAMELISLSISGSSSVSPQWAAASQ